MLRNTNKRTATRTNYMYIKYVFMNVKQILYLDGYECFFHTHTNGCTCEKRK